ncbi:MAG: GNAT family N-acetyltransferase [Tissierellales bacterium]|nr:GNAT family N-acetyltransferase [Tissierellales bacterium]
MNHPQGNIFQMPQMYDAYASTPLYQPIVVSCFNDKNLTGILLAVIQKEYSGLLGKFSARSIIWGGPLTDSEDVTQEILSQYNKQIAKAAVFSQVRNFHVLNPSQKNAFEINGYTYEPHLNIIVNLPSDIDQFWKGIKRNRKDGINKAKRQGFSFEVIREPIYIEPFYRLLENSYKSIKLPYPAKSFFTSLNSKAYEYMKWFVLKKYNMPVVILVGLIYKRTIYAFYIGTTKDTAILNLRPVDIFYYEVMCWGIKNGYRNFDWMGAGKPNKEYGVRKFKLQYGGEILEMGRFGKVHKPLIMGLSKIGFWCWKKIRR